MFETCNLVLVKVQCVILASICVNFVCSVNNHNVHMVHILDDGYNDVCM